MEREDKVISLELSKQIYIEHKRLGIVVESEWWWINDANRTDEHWIIWKKKGYEGTPYPAYDTSELGERLPDHYFTQRHDKNWITCSDYGEDGNNYHIGCMAEKGIRLTEAEARGKMYLWLLQNGYVKGEGE